MANSNQLALSAMEIAQKQVTQTSIDDLEEYPCNCSMRKPFFFLGIFGA